MLPLLSLLTLGDATGQRRALSSYWVTRAPVHSRWGRQFVLPPKRVFLRQEQGWGGGYPRTPSAYLARTGGSCSLPLRTWAFKGRSWFTYSRSSYQLHRPPLPAALHPPTSPRMGSHRPQDQGSRPWHGLRDLPELSFPFPSCVSGCPWHRNQA